MINHHQQASKQASPYPPSNLLLERPRATLPFLQAHIESALQHCIYPLESLGMDQAVRWMRRAGDAMTYAGKHACRQMASSSAARRRWPPSQAWPHRVASVPCRMRVMRPWRGSPAFRFGDSTTKLTSSDRFLPPRARPPAVDACTLCGAVRCGQSLVTPGVACARGLHTHSLRRGVWRRERQFPCQLTLLSTCGCV
jgi:hypothetical protein